MIVRVEPLSLNPLSICEAPAGLCVQVRTGASAWDVCGAIRSA